MFFFTSTLARLFFFFTFFFYTNGAALGNVPLGLKAKLHRLYPDAQNISWRAPDNAHYEAVFAIAYQPILVCFDTIGNIVLEGKAVDIEVASDELKDNLITEIQEQMKEHPQEDMEIAVFLITSPKVDTLYYLDFFNEFELFRTILDKKGKELRNYEVRLLGPNDTLGVIVPDSEDTEELEEDEKEIEKSDEEENNAEEDNKTEEDPIDE
jgi:hypothetical protein